MTENPNFDQWAIVEIMGRQVIAGRVTEQTIGGTSFIRVDVPEVNGNPAFTRFYGAGAIYAMTPCSEDVAKLALKRFQPEPVTVYVPELRQLTSSAVVGEDRGLNWDDEEDFDDEDFDEEDY